MGGGEAGEIGEDAPAPAPAPAERVAAVLARELRWTPERTRAELESFAQEAGAEGLDPR